MKFTETFIRGVWVIEPEPVSDERGFFSRIVCENEFAEHGLPNHWVQQNISFNHKKGTLRGMHYQKGSAAEIKVIRCTCGAIYDAVIDLRKDSPTYKQWVGVELSAENRKMFYIPEGFAHGYLTLTDKAEVTYLVSAFYAPGAEAGIRYDDPSVGIEWPIAPTVVSEKDKNWPQINELPTDPPPVQIKRLFDYFKRPNYGNSKFQFMLDEYRALISQFTTIFLFGAGHDGWIAVKFLHDILTNKQVFFIDNNEALHGTEICNGIYCYGKEKMFGCDPVHTIILITSSLYAEQIYDEMLGKGFKYVDYTEYQRPEKLGMTYIDCNFIKTLLSFHNSARHLYDLHEEDLYKVFNLFHDTWSQKVFYRILCNRLIGILCLREIVTLPQYFPDEIKERFSNNEVFLDCGAYTGDTVEEFRQQTNDQFKAIYSFEMSRKLYRIAKDNKSVKDSRIHLLNIGVSNKNGIADYNSKRGSYVHMFSGEPVEQAKIRTIDSLVTDGTITECVTFVKMDIEGAELDALQGMKHLMQRDKPKLAICVYHKAEDLWEIPLYIHRVVPEYKFILRHHDVRGLTNETVLYAYI